MTLQAIANPKYAAEFFLEFRSMDRFIYRVSDLHHLADFNSQELNERVDKCHIYLLCKRPRLSIVPGTIEVLTEAILQGFRRCSGISD